MKLQGRNQARNRQGTRERYAAAIAAMYIRVSFKVHGRTSLPVSILLSPAGAALAQGGAHKAVHIHTQDTELNTHKNINQPRTGTKAKGGVIPRIL